MPFIKVNGKSLFYTIDGGDGSGPVKSTTLFIHGLGSSSCFYKTVIPALSATTRCIALDTPGSGLSDLSSDQSIETITEDATGLLYALNIQENVIVVGHSMGGIVATHLAAQNPSLVTGVVLLGPVNPSPALAEPFEKRIEVVKSTGLEILANTIPKGATGSKSGPIHHAFIRSLILGTRPEGYISLCSSISKARKPNYSAVKAPLLLLAGGDDKTAPLASSQAILEAYGTESQKKTLEILDGVGHWHCVEAPEEVSRFILAFIKSIS